MGGGGWGVKENHSSSPNNVGQDHEMIFISSMLCRDVKGTPPK